MYFPSVMLLALDDERARDARRGARRGPRPARIRRRLPLTARTRVVAGLAGLLPAGARS